MNRNVIIALSVVVFHIAALWALQTGLLRRAVELVVPAEILSEFIEPPAPKVAPPPPAPPVAVRQPVAKAPVPVRTVAPQPIAIADPTPSPNAPAGVTAPQPSLPAIATPVAAAPPAPARVELPSSDADYLQNPKPPYPALSKRLGEQGKVVVRVLIGVDGTAQKAEIQQSSGFDRLDQSALATVMRWRYVPGKRAGIPEAMWFNVPISFVLE
ncbi:MAG: energy transducer TonB [Rhodoferax sp.]|uniref:energy transducer TonB n=1 Tax=Rhodoferax sp. TaxID=50421 RepID=UPI00271CEE77|nr:energy transducer TonB [Rhodoferax sp.]MDO8450634.1 energy transducer TonB [Rhodoferax sp.]